MHLIAVRVNTLPDNKIQLELDIVDPINPIADSLRQYILSSMEHLESDSIKTSSTQFITVTSDCVSYQLSSLEVTITYNQSLILSILTAIEEYFSTKHEDQDYHFAFGKSKIYDDLEDDAIGYPLSCNTESHSAELELPLLKYLPCPEEYIALFQVDQLIQSSTNSKLITHYVLQEIDKLFSNDLNRVIAEKNENQYLNNNSNLFFSTTQASFNHKQETTNNTIAIKKISS